MTPEQWNAFFTIGHPHKRIKHMVMVECRKCLTSLMPGVNITTKELVEMVYPEAMAKYSPAAFDNRKKIFAMVFVLARDELSDCCVKGEASGQFMGKPKRPWIWFCPEDSNNCTACGQPLPAVDKLDT